jgi:hypothetical protein
MDDIDFPVNDAERDLVRSGRIVDAIKAYRARYELSMHRVLPLAHAHRTIELTRTLILSEPKPTSELSPEEKAKALESLVSTHLDVAVRGIAARIGVTHQDVFAQFAFEAMRARG